MAEPRPGHGAAISVDAGTTLIKSVAYAEDGSVVHLARRPTTVASPHPGFAEQNMDEVWNAVADAVREAARAVGGQVTMISMTAQGDGCWLVDADGRPTGPAVLWNDARAAALVDAWRHDGAADAAFRRSGSVGFSGLAHAILGWLAQHDPDRIDRSFAALTCGGWLFAQLTGQLGVDESDAAAPWLDINSREYSTEVLDIFSLRWAERLLPPLRRADDRAAPIRADVAADLGVPPGIPVVMSPYDIAATAIGAGAVEVSQAVTILGTTLCTEVVAANPDLDGTPTGLTIPLGVGTHVLRSLPTLAGTQVLAWAADVLGVADEAAVCELADSGPAGAGGLMFLPYLSPAGERVPFVDPAARGTFAGLSFDHGRPEVARSVLEGLTYLIRECLEINGTTTADLRVCGGGANSQEWCRLIADVTGVPVTRVADDEVGARGAYLCGLVATGATRDHALAVAEHVRARDVFEPDPEHHRRHDDIFGRFAAVREDAMRSWPRLAELRDAG